MRSMKRRAWGATAWLLGVALLLSACGQAGVRTSEAAPATSAVSSTDIQTTARLHAASEVITDAADENGWALSAVMERHDMTGLTVEVMGEDAMPSLEQRIRALVEVPVTFRYGGGPPLIRPAHVTTSGRSEH